MTFASDPTDAPLPIHAPYAPDPLSRTRRLVRLAILIVVSGFCFFYGSAFALFAPALMLPLVAPLPLLTLVAIWALPETRTAPTRTLTILTFAFFACLVMWPNYIAFAPKGLPWITMARLTGFPLFLVLLICTSVSAEFRTRLAESLSSAPLIWRLLVAFSVVQFISIAFSKTTGTSLDKFIQAQVSMTAIFFLSAYVFLKPGRVERMAGMIWAMAMFVGVIGIFEWRKAGILWAHSIPKFLQIPDPSVQFLLATHVRAADGTYRTQSTFSSALGFGEYLALTVPFVIHFAMGAFKPTVRIIAALSLPYLLFIVFITGSRGAVVGCILSFFLYAVAWFVLRWRADRGTLMSPAALVVGAPVAGVVLLLMVMFTRLHKYTVGGGAEQSSTQSRIEQLHMAIPKFLSHPWGYGIGRGAQTVGYVSWGSFITLDSYFITLAIEYGIQGFLLYITFLGASIYNAGKNALDSTGMDREYTFLVPIGIAMLNFLVIKSVFSEEANHPIVFMYIGMIVALAARIRRDKGVMTTARVGERSLLEMLFGAEFGARKRARRLSAPGAGA